MAGAVIENLSTKKLIIIIVALLLLEIGCVILGALHSPNPTHTIQVSAVHCIRNKTKAWYLPETCEQAGELDSEKAETIKKPSDIIFSFRLPTNRQSSRQMIPWFQFMLTILQLNIEYDKRRPVAVDASLTLNIKVAYSDDVDSYKNEDLWTSIVQSKEVRPLDCVTPAEEGHLYDCEPIHLFQLGSVPHKYYLVNFYLPTWDHTSSPNHGIGKFKRVDSITIAQTGGFTKIWIIMKSILCLVLLLPVIWFWRRIKLLQRKPMLIEKAIFGLGLSMLFLDVPFELITIYFEASWMLVFVDVRQGFFYAVLFCFWIIFTGEHLMDQPNRNKLSTYKWQLASICVMCAALLTFELAERGAQIINPCSTIWSYPNFAEAMLIVGSISGALYMLLLGYLVVRVIIATRFKRQVSVRGEKALQFKKTVARFRNLLLLTLTTAGLTVAFFILQKDMDGALGDYVDADVNVASGFFTGVYSLWNIYVMLVLFMYAPSHKRYDFSEDDDTSEQLVVPLNSAGSDYTQVFQLTQQKTNED